METVERLEADVDSDDIEELRERVALLGKLADASVLARRRSREEPGDPTSLGLCTRGKSMSDISLAVGDGARRMTYAELAAVRGISPASAKRLTQRHRWGRQIGNDGVVRVTVPLSALVNTAKIKGETVACDDFVSSATTAIDPVTPAAVTADVANDVILATDVLARAIETLREQLVKADQREESERRRGERAEREVEDGRKRIDELQTALADARTAEGIAASEAAALRAQDDRRREWGFIRRLRWAVRKT